MQVITITGFRRPQLFQALLQSLLVNDLAGWRINIQIEPSDAAHHFSRLADALLVGVPYTFVINTRVLGVRHNPFQLLCRTFDEGAELVLYLEEDLLVAPDTTKLARWYAQNHNPQWMTLALLSGGCGSPGFISDPLHPNLLFPSKSFNSLGFACLKSAWQRDMRDVWLRDLPQNTTLRGDPAPGWDWAVSHHLIRSDGLQSLQPVAARAVHNGREGGIHCDPRWHDLAFTGLELAPSSDQDQPYVVCPPEALPPSVRRQAMLWEQVNFGLDILGRTTAEVVELRAQCARWRKSTIWQRIARVVRPD